MFAPYSKERYKLQYIREKVGAVESSVCEGGGNVRVLDCS